jgi:hypothetical protein
MGIIWHVKFTIVLFIRSLWNFYFALILLSFKNIWHIYLTVVCFGVCTLLFPWLYGCLKIYLCYLFCSRFSTLCLIVWLFKTIWHIYSTVICEESICYFALIVWLFKNIFLLFVFGVCILLSAWLYGCLKIYDIFILLLFVRSLYSTLCLIVCHYGHLYFDIWRRRSTFM